MAGNTENIEAKLAAYIDGDLDAQGRAEIEKHLTANPQHRTLIEQLSKQRDLLRELPREEAPDDILEALQNQMERSVLLGDDDAGEAPAHMKIHRWPQVFAAAAIVALTVGLGAIIYFVLPRGNGTDDYAVATQRGAMLEGDRVSTDPTAPSISDDAKSYDARHDGDAAPAGPLPSKTEAAKAMAADESMMKREAGTALKGGPVAATENEAGNKKGDVFAARGFGGGGGAGGIAIEDVVAAQQLSQNADIARQLKDAPGGLKDNAVFVVVNSANPTAARSQVTQYLESNKIAWDTVAQPMPQPLDISQDQVVHLDRVQKSQVQVKIGEQRAAEAKSGLALQEVDKSNATTDTNAAAAANTAPSAPAASPPAGGVAGQQPQQPAPSQQQQEAVQAPAGVADAARSLRKDAPSAETMSNVQIPDPALSEAEAGQKAKQAVDSRETQQLVQQETLHMRQRLTQQARPASESRLIVARGMTKQQAQELSSNLSKQQAVQRAAIYESRVGADTQMKEFARANTLGVAPTTQPGRLGGYVVGPQVVAEATPTTSPTAASVAERLEDVANRAPTTSPSIVPATQPADQQSAFGAVAAVTPASQPTTQPTAAQVPAPLSLTTDGFEFAAATQPTTAAAAEERVDVVILVNEDAPPINAGEQQQQQQFDATQQPAAPAMPTPPATTAPTTQSAPATQPAL